jgi:glycosyltransferase involved in cell wall biosynthesis
MNVLLIMDNAPDYRETFLRELGESVNLTVLGRRCEDINLSAPLERRNYKYQDLRSWQLFGICLQPELLRWIFRHNHFDVICCDLNVRNLIRLPFFLALKLLGTKFVWRGQIFGNAESIIVYKLKEKLLRLGDGCLVYSEPIAIKVKESYGVDAKSYNNTEVALPEFREGKYSNDGFIRLIFVGRNQPRKRLDRLLLLAKRNPDVKIRLIGPGMDFLAPPPTGLFPENVEIFGKMIGNQLEEHFDWSDIVVNPGHVGLLVMNAARYGKGIVIDSGSKHAPEYYLAKEANQPFIDFGDTNAVDDFLMQIRNDKKICAHLGNKLQEVARQKYTVEHMTEVHVSFFRNLITSDRKAHKKH